jgi:calcium/calmodulin-dependent protein kinase I
MELVEGREMFDVLNTLGRYDEEDARRLFSQLLNGILHLHQNGICHRDLKPHNILCEKGTCSVKI